jgi:hypothetical protein
MGPNDSAFSPITRNITFIGILGFVSFFSPSLSRYQHFLYSTSSLSPSLFVIIKDLFGGIFT